MSVTSAASVTSATSANPESVPASCPVSGQDAALPIGERFELTFGEVTPTDLYDEARANEPVCYSERLGLWIVTGEAEMRTMLRDPKRYSSVKHWIPYQEHPEVQAILDTGLPVKSMNMFTSDPPRHAYLRGLLNAEFTPQRIASKEARMRQIAHEVIDGVEHRGEMNFSDEFGDPFCMTVMGDILGYPREDQELLKRLEFGYINVALASCTLEQKKQAARDHVAHQEYYADLIEQRRRDPKDDLISRLIAESERNGEQMNTAAIIGECLSLQIAGHSTPVQCLGFLLQGLTRGGKTLGEVDCPPQVLISGFEEIVRLTLLGYSRRTTEPVELGGRQIPEDALVYMVVAAANRDKEVFGDIEFDPHREKAHKHLGFGWGRHFCIGAHLARAEGRIAMEVLRERLPGLRVAPDFVPDWLPNTAFRKVRRMPVVWEVTR